ncbi:HD domain-containing protein [Paenibacillus sp. GCM10012307]|uniref:HD domain-containing protein n=1 Tax=Paenibacillus roseus TaxID=2798579 RepID=A0A934MQ90_9BACL|nr:HD domain-containing protein [Paenibacillus roseus]MBJ6361628.1 HD domain-containing protein [Paenibacillus roseus]
MPDIRDPIHGFISLTKDEQRIVDTPEFQRLRRIRQLATTYLLYPSAEHTRFPHSLGVMQVSSLVFDKVFEKRKDVLGWSEDERKKYRQMLRLASLLHDIAHAPFSHVSDDLFDENVKGHEGMAGKIITNSNVTPIVDKIGAEYGFNSSSIAALITGNAFHSDERLIADIFASELDSDKMDYLLRDSLYTGVKYGNFDLDRVLNVLSLCYREGEWKLGVEYDGVEAVEGLILARYFMFTQVYLHRTRRIYDNIMIQLLKEILVRDSSTGRLPLEVQDFIKWDDYSVIEKAKEIKSPWADRFLNRVHLKCIWESEPAVTREERVIQRECELQIKDELELKYKPYQVIIDRYQKTPMKFALSDGSPTISVISKNDPTAIYSLKDRAPVVAKLEEPIYICRIYTDSDVAKDVHDYVKMRYEVLRRKN